MQKTKKVNEMRKDKSKEDNNFKKPRKTKQWQELERAQN